MKKILILLILLPCICQAFKCPQNTIVKITCIQQENNETIKTYVNVPYVDTTYHGIFPECKIKKDTVLRDSNGNFRIYYIAKNLCGIVNYDHPNKVRFSTGQNWFFRWVPSLSRIWVYTPATKKFKEVK